MNLNRYIIVFLALVFSLYTISSVLTGNLLPLAILFGLTLFVTFPKWSSLGILGIFLFKESAFQIPIPTSPDMWHFCGLLAVIGGGLSLLANKNRPLNLGRGVNLLAVLFLILGIYIICLVFVHGMGIKSLITTFSGKRFLKFGLMFMLPFFVYINRYDVSKIPQLIKIGFITGLSYLVIEVILHVQPSLYGVASLIFKAPHDAISFATMDEKFGYNRYSGIATASIALAMFVLSTRKKYKFGSYSLVFWIIIIALVIGSFFAGSRARIINIPCCIVAVMWVTRSIKPPVIIGFAALVTIALTTAYSGFERLPGAIQRTLTILPGMESRLRAEGHTDTLANDGGREWIQELSYEVFQEMNLLTGVGYSTYDPDGLEYIDTSSIDYTYASCYFDALLLTPWIYFGAIGFFLIALIVIIITWESVRTLFYLRKHYPDDFMTKVFAIYFAIFALKFALMTFQLAYVINFIEVPAYQGAILIVIRKMIAMGSFEKANNENQLRVENSEVNMLTN